MIRLIADKERLGLPILLQMHKDPRRFREQPYKSLKENERPECFCQMYFDLSKEMNVDLPQRDGRIAGVATEITKKLQEGTLHNLLNSGGKFRKAMSDEECKEAFGDDLENLKNLMKRKGTKCPEAFINANASANSSIPRTDRTRLNLTITKTQSALSHCSNTSYSRQLTRPLKLSACIANSGTGTSSKYLDGEGFEEATEEDIAKAIEEGKKLIKWRRPNTDNTNPQYAYIIGKFTRTKDGDSYADLQARRLKIV
jgi:hypothetical protein